MKRQHRPAVIAILTAAIVPVQFARADQTKADNASTLDQGASWVSMTAPTSSDLAIWSGAYNTSGSLSAAFNTATPTVSWLGIQIGATTGSQASSGLISIGGTGAAVTGSQVTVGGGGINLSGANENLVINSKMTTIATDQTWDVVSGHSLRLGSTGTGAANAIMNGSGNILVTGGGVVDLNEGGASGFSDANSFATFTGTWTVNAGATLRAIRNGASAFGNNTSAGAITLNGGTLAVGGISGSQGSWSWNTNITLGSGFTSNIDEQLFSGTGRYLKLNGNITGSATANLLFKDTATTSTFTNSNLGYILTGSNTMGVGSTITIGGPVENGIAGRRTDLRVGGVNGTGGTDVTTAAGPGGSLGAAAVVDNGILTFAYNNSNSVTNNISGTGGVNVGGSASSANAAISGAGSQVLTLSGSNTYTGMTAVAGGSTLIVATPGTFGNAYTGGLTIGYSGTNGTTGTANISAGTNLTGVGPIAINSGTLNVNSDVTSAAVTTLGQGSGTGTLNILAGTVNLNGIAINTTGSANLSLTGGVLNLGSSGISAGVNGSTSLNLGAATIGASANWASNQNFNLTDSTVGTTFNTTDSVDETTPRTITLSGSVSGGGLMTVTGNGKLYLDGNNSENGPITVNTGATLGGNGSISASTIISSGGNLEAGQLGTGSLNLNGGLTFNGSANINIGTLANYSGNVAINDTGALTANGASHSITINVANLVGASVGSSYRLIGYSGGSIGGTGDAAFQLGSLPSRAVGTLSDTGSELDVTINSFAYLIWTGAGNLSNGWDTSTANWNLSSGGTTTYLDSPSPDAVVFDDSAPVGNTTVNLNTVVHPNAVTFNNNSNNYTIAGTGGINGATGLMMNGTGTVNLMTSNGFTGPVTINAGITSLQNSGALGASAGVTVSSGATLQLQGGITTGNVPLTINGTGASGQNGVLVNSGGSNTYAGAVTLAGNSTISSDSGSLTLSSTTAMSGSGNALTLTGAGNGTISSTIGIGSGSVTLTGTGLWTFSGTNTYTGPTNVVSGTLAVTKTSALSSSSAINLGTSDSGTPNIALNISGGVTLSSPITTNNPGTGTISINVTGATTCATTGIITLNQNLIINNTDTAVLPSAFTGSTLPFGGLNVSGGLMTGAGGITFSGTGVTLLITADSNYFAYTGPTLVTGNTLVEYYSSKSTNPNSVLNISSGSTVVGTLLSAGEFGGLIGSGRFANTVQGTGSGSISIGYLNDAVDNFSGVLSGPIILTKTGSGMQIFSGSNTYTGSTVVTGGVLQAGVITTPGVSGAFGVNTNVTVSGGALDLNGFNTSIGSLSDGGSNSGAVTLGTGTLTITGGSNASFGGAISGAGGLVINVPTKSQTLTGSNTYSGPTNVAAGTLVISTSSALPTGTDVMVNTGATLVLDSQNTASSANLLNINGNMIVHNASLPIMSAEAQTAFNNGWNGSTGLASSSAASNTTHLTALGIIQNDDGTNTGTAIYTTFAGQSVGDSDVLVKYTYYGDANLDGTVNSADYAMIDNGYLMNLTGWQNGDFNYDNVVNGSDYTLIDNAFNTQGAQFAAAIATAQITGATSAVPEPATLSLLSLSAIGLLGRRRRRA